MALSLASTVERQGLSMRFLGFQATHSDLNSRQRVHRHAPSWVWHRQDNAGCCLGSPRRGLHARLVRSHDETH